MNQGNRADQPHDRPAPVRAGLIGALASSGMASDMNRRESYQAEIRMQFTIRTNGAAISDGFARVSCGDWSGRSPVFFIARNSSFCAGARSRFNQMSGRLPMDDGGAA
jgi:hypothetical protein